MISDTLLDAKPHFSQKPLQFISVQFLPRDALSAKRGIAIACLSVCLSVCPSVCDVGEL